jgi:phosphoglycolate phosphatase
MVEAILFDFDLTLADSSAGVTECANHALRALGFAAAEPALVHQTIGLSLVQSFRALSGNDDPGLGAAYAKHFGEHADRVMAELVCLYPGAADTIRDLRGRGLRTAIVSTKFRHRIEDILKRADSSGLVDVIVGGEDVAQHKPHPESLLRALRPWTCAQRAVHAGSHLADAQAAGSADIPFSGGPTCATRDETGAAFAPLRIIGSVTELPAVLDHFLDPAASDSDADRRSGRGGSK